MLTSLEMCNQWRIFELTPQSPPWSYAGLLRPHARVREACAQRMLDLLKLIVRLEASRHALATQLLASLHFRLWAVVREPLELLIAGGGVPMGMAVEYVRECVSDYLHTRMAECTFNDLHDDEARGAIHKQRGEHGLTAKCMRSAHTRWSDIPQVDVAANDAGTLCRASAFHPEQLQRGERNPGTDSASILGQKFWVWDDDRLLGAAFNESFDSIAADA